MKTKLPLMVTVRLDAMTATALEAWRRDDDDSTVTEAARKAIRAFLRSTDTRSIRTMHPSPRPAGSGAKSPHP